MITKVEFRVEKDLAKMAEMIKEIDAETTEMKRKYRKLLEFVKSIVPAPILITQPMEWIDSRHPVATGAYKLLREIGEA